MRMPLRPLITICGTTGVGKSNLAIDLALHLAQGNHKHGWNGARIINADSMQVYAGMDLITNKVPESEMRGVEHLLMGFKRPGEQYVVGEWVEDAMKLIEETHSRREIPIVVGGTAYWIQHLLFPGRLVGSSTPSGKTTPTNPDISPRTMSDDLAKTISQLPPELLDLFNTLPDQYPSARENPEAALTLHNLIETLDPIVAKRWHWKDTRRVLRSIEILKTTGRRASEIIEEQSKSTLKPRYRTLCFWLYAKPDVLNARLNARVDNMIEQGLLDEIRTLQRMASSASSEDSQDTDYTLGIYQSIGYREFHQYLCSPESPEKEKAFAEAVDRMKMSTRQYAKRQISWIRNKLVPAIRTANAAVISDSSADKGEPRDSETSFYLLDATELGDKWISDVREPAIRITEDFLSQTDDDDDDARPLPDPLSLSETAREMLTIAKKDTNPLSVLAAHNLMICPVCTLDKDRPVMIEEGSQWEVHRMTQSHKRLANKEQNDLKYQAIREQKRLEKEERERQKSCEQRPSDVDLPP